MMPRAGCQKCTPSNSSAPRRSWPLPSPSAALGLLGVFCSAMIYITTRRAFWSGELVFTKFFGTTFLLGTSATAAILAWMALFTPTPMAGPAQMFSVIAVILGGALLGWESAHFQNALTNEESTDHRSAKVMWHLRRALLLARAALSAGAIVAMLSAMASNGIAASVSATLSCLLACAAQVIERYFFFTAVIAPRMPGPLVPDSTPRA